jgi:predicted solute-binding protein
LAAIALEERLETAMLAYPFRAGWVEADGVTLAPSLGADDAGTATLALLDSVTALSLLPAHVVVRDVAVVWRAASMLTLTTYARPDEVESATVAAPGVSPAGRALAAAVLGPFYGIAVAGWSERAQPVDATHVTVSEGPAALIAAADEELYQEDLGRAWYLLTDRPFVSHVAVAARRQIAGDPRSVAAAMERLRAARDAGAARGRELRRDLSKAHGIDRETLTETLAAATYALDDAAVDGLAELARRSGLALPRNALVSVGQS